MREIRIMLGSEEIRMVVKNLMILPMTICCDSCGNHIFKDTRFTNFRRQDSDETRLGVQIVRIHFNCPTCSSMIIIRNDPETADFAVDSGATRRLIPWPVTPIEDL